MHVRGVMERIYSLDETLGVMQSIGWAFEAEEEIFKPSWETGSLGP